MTNRKAIVALINGCICIDPSDAERVDMDKIKAEALKALGKPVNVVIAPINEWMPKSGTEALMNEAMKDLIPSKLPTVKDPINYIKPSKNARKRNKHRKWYF